MKFTDVKIDGFGVWSGLTLERLSPECTAFYGPNEAGKTTLLESIRGTLYGYTAERRLRYLPPLRGEPAGATISATTFDEGYVRIHRSVSSHDSIGDLLVHSPDGTVQGELQLRRILHDVDETTYQNIFAIGLREIQELGTLTDLEAAKWLYALTVGLDRVSLCDCVTEVKESRRNLCGSDLVDSGATEPSGTSQFGLLLAQRDRLQADIGKLTGISRDYERLVAQRDSIASDIAHLEAILPKQQAEERALDVAVMVYETWHRREALAAQIDAMATANDWPTEAMARMDRITKGARKWRRRLRQLRRQRLQGKDEIAKIQTNDALWRQTARIAAVAEHDEWILSLEQELNAADTTAKTLGVQEDSHRRKFVDLATADGASAIASAASGGSQSHLTPAWAALRGPAAAISKARRRLRAARSKSEQEKQQFKARAGELNSALLGGDKRQLTSAIDSAGQRVSQLRKRIQIDDRLAELELTKEELDSRIADLQERQVLPPWMIISIGAIFVLGIVLILSGLLLPTSVTGSLGWPMAWLGILATGSAVAAKVTTERSLANQLRESRSQLQLVETQTEEAEKQRAELDRALPKSATSLPERLHTAEQELARFEALLPLEAQRQSAEQTANQSDELLSHARRRYRKAARNWRAALAAAGMPETLSPPQARAMAESGSQLSLVQRQLADAQSDLNRRRRELAGVARQIEQIFLAAGLKPQSTKSSEQLRQLQRALEDDSLQRQRRETLGQQIKKFHGRHNLIYERLARLRRRRTRLLRECRVADAAEFQRRAAQSAQLTTLITERDATAREIASILAGIASEASMAELLAGKPFEQLELELRAAQQMAESTRREHAAKLELRGRIQEQMRILAGDRSLARRRFELVQVDAQLADAARHWQVLTATQQILTELKLTYERDRQPETLQEASRYLAKMTSGRYRRVWTSLDEHLLRVDDENGRALSLDVLSRGTREQLFLSLRLALVSLFSRRGIKLPMILDDVLVNFDTQRAAATVDVLAEFGQQGNQLLVFTCHEHIARLFKARDLDVRRLPDHAIGGPALPFEAEVEPARRAKPRAPKVEAPPPPPLPEPIPDPIPVFMPPPIAIVPPPPVETVIATPVVSRPKVSHVRIDQPKRVWRLSPIFRRWAAEEFSGELDDQVNPRWLLNGDAEVRIEPPAAVRKLDLEPFPLLASAGYLESITVIGPTALRIFDDEPAAVLADPLPGNEDWEL